ncbi:PilX N-terminal domain-containing pilus assembly protein [Arsukibacterium sp.]|uniref:pilus assembly PilX family protein n=1 Tax=Arsukibacterium sp. TaxID=1977258 RepID=UPI00299D1505|nr:PilX N-terminal domain-containing pilus assembly protein [Arsukibacterium sp.]MDX1678499.1 PilX N-terminal domain-containing pilus assembly protein [Arsukibacterium sp.]
MRNSMIREKGVALIVALLLLLAISTLAITSMRNAGNQEKMTANLYDKELSLQAVESTIFAAERLVEANVLSTPNLLPERVITATTPDYWLDPATVWQTRAAENAQMPATQFIIEHLGLYQSYAGCRAVSANPAVDCEMEAFRITARTAPVAGRAVVMLQTTVGVPL